MLDGTDIEEAKRLRRNYNQRLRYWQNKWRLVDRNDNDEVMRIHNKLLKNMGDKCVSLQAIGFRETDETEEPPNVLVPLTQAWIDEQRNKETELDRLSRKARTGTDEDVRKFIQALAGSYEK